MSDSNTDRAQTSEPNQSELQELIAINEEIHELLNDIYSLYKDVGDLYSRRNALHEKRMARIAEDKKDGISSNE